MHTDDVIEELWRAKDAHGAKYGWDIHVMAEALRRQQREEGRKVVSLAHISVADNPPDSVSRV